ncbi:hypothetical protein BDR05DRAFT_945663 [Suillus weaverae]|nr:hypothetical protein BDR05DRAFT_945663 [Suillus weaverae]
MKALMEKFEGFETLPFMVASGVCSFIIEIGIFGCTDIWLAIYDMLVSSNDFLNYTMIRKDILGSSPSLLEMLVEVTNADEAQPASSHQGQGMKGVNKKGKRKYQADIAMDIQKNSEMVVYDPDHLFMVLND